MSHRFPYPAALRRCAWAVLVTALVADALTLKQRGDHRSAHIERGRADHLAEQKVASPCAAWVQEHAGQTIDAGQVPPCPCLMTPPPLMSPEQTQAVEVKASADNAMLKGLTEIEEAAVKASEPLMKKFKEIDSKEVATEAKTLLEAAEKNGTDTLKSMLAGEKARQEIELSNMEMGANMAAQLSADHVRQTAEEWASNQARNYIVLNANSTMGAAVDISRKTAVIRQQATALAKGAIKSAAQTLEVAKEAQLAIAKVPEKTMMKAKKYAQDTAEEQDRLNTEMSRIDASIRSIAKVAAESYSVALVTLNQAHNAELTAKEALETSRGNAEKIAVLKERATKVANKANSAQKELEKANA